MFPFDRFRMNTYSVAVLGLLCIGAVVAQNYDAVSFNTNLYQVDSNPAVDSPYWWMSKGSPFKRSYEIGPPQQRFDNPFLGGSPAKYSGPGYLPPNQSPSNQIPNVRVPPPPPPPAPTQPPRVPCGGNRVCVNRNQCLGGLVDASQVNNANHKQVSLIYVIFSPEISASFEIFWSTPNCIAPNAWPLWSLKIDFQKEKSLSCGIQFFDPLLFRHVAICHAVMRLLHRNNKWVFYLFCFATSFNRREPPRENGNRSSELSLMLG